MNCDFQCSGCFNSSTCVMMEEIFYEEMREEAEREQYLAESTCEN